MDVPLCAFNCWSTRCRERFEPSQTGRRLFVREYSIHTATADPSQPRNLLFVVTGLKQVPDELVTYDAIGMITLTSMFHLPSLGRRGKGERLSSQEPGSCFENVSIPLEEALESFRQVLLKMKAI